MTSSKPLVNFQEYILKVLKQIHPDLNLSKNVKSQINSFLNVLGEKIAEKSSFLSNSSMSVIKRKTKKESLEKPVNKNKQHTIRIKDIQSASAIIFGLYNLLYTHAKSEGTKAVNKYLLTTSGSKTEHISRTKRAKLLFSVSRVEKMLRMSHNGRVANLACVYLSAILEYITAEILELAGNNSKLLKRTTISSRSLMHIMQDDEEINNLTTKINWRVIGGGVIPHIHAKLLPKEKIKINIPKIKIIKHE